MSAVYFLSDLHLAHKNICKFREGFTSVEQHNALIKENYHKRVTKREILYTSLVMLPSTKSLLQM